MGQMTLLQKKTGVYTLDEKEEEAVGRTIQEELDKERTHGKRPSPPFKA